MTLAFSIASRWVENTRAALLPSRFTAHRPSFRITCTVFCMARTFIVVHKHRFADRFVRISVRGLVPRIRASCITLTRDGLRSTGYERMVGDPEVGSRRALPAVSLSVGNLRCSRIRGNVMGPHRRRRKGFSASMTARGAIHRMNQLARRPMDSDRRREERGPAATGSRGLRPLGPRPALDGALAGAPYS
jgi:hypothetical protein